MTRAQTVVFGDYLNDLEMLDAGRPVVRDGQRPPGRDRPGAVHTAPANTEDGVLRTLERLLADA